MVEDVLVHITIMNDKKWSNYVLILVVVEDVLVLQVSGILRLHELCLNPFCGVCCSSTSSFYC